MLNTNNKNARINRIGFGQIFAGDLRGFMPATYVLSFKEALLPNFDYMVNVVVWNPQLLEELMYKGNSFESSWRFVDDK